MSLSSDLISQFVKITRDEPETKKESVASGTVVPIDPEDISKGYGIRLDGSPDTSEPIPVSADDNTTTTELAEGNRVLVTIRNHTAIITGNLSSPSVGTEAVSGIRDTANTASSKADAATGNVTNLSNQITKFGVAIGTKVEAEEFRTALASVTERLDAKDIQVQSLTAKDAEITDLVSEKAKISDLNAVDAKINTLQTDYGDFKNVTATKASVEALSADHATFKQTTSDNFTSVEANIEALNADKLSATDIEGKYANIDFSNIGEAAIKKIFSETGLIENLVVGDGTVTGRLVGVTIIGDLIEGGTVVADKLVVKGEDGLYYKLNTDGVSVEEEQTEYNSLDGSIIKAKSITATKISVDDLVAFGATVGGFNITQQALYSGVKESVDNSTQGVYLGKDGQVAIGDSDNFLRYFKDENGNWRLEISAESILFGGESKSSASDIKALTEHVKIGIYTDPNTNESEPCVELSEGDSDFKQVITNTKTVFMDGSTEKTRIDTDGISSTKVHAEDESGIGEFVWKRRNNGNLGLVWKGGNT